MPGQERHVKRADRQARQGLTRVGHEIRIARLNHDLSQAVAGEAADVSQASWGRIERGEAPGVPIATLARVLAVVGLDLHVRAYPTGRPLRDQAHLALLERLRVRLGDGATWMTEVPMPNAADMRAWDALIRVMRVRVGVEAETRARDAQELQRRLALKRRDGGVDHVILLLADTRHNRAFLRGVGDGFLSAFPLAGSVALARLAQTTDPRGSAIVLL